VEDEVEEPAEERLQIETEREGLIVEIVAYFYPDMLEEEVYVKSGISLEEYFDELRELCERHLSTLQRAHVLICAEKGGNQILSITGSTKKLYALKEAYKEYDSVVWDICNKYFKDAKERNKVKIRTVEEFRNTDVILKGYTIPQDYDYGPEYYVKCKMSEALEKIKEIVNVCPEEFYNLQFHVWTRDNDYLFCIRRDLETIHLGDKNVFGLTKPMVKEALGIKPEGSLPKEFLEQEVIFVFRPDGAEPDISFEHRLPMGECIDSARRHCAELPEYRERMEIQVCAGEDKKPVFYIYGGVPGYRVFDEYKELEPVISEIYNTYWED